MNKLKVLIVGRKSHAAESAQVVQSRSVFSRISEPFEYLFENEKIELACFDENNVSLKKNMFDVIIFSKHMSEVSIQIANRAKELGIKIIYDIDDFILSFPETHPASSNDAGKKIFYEHMILADVVTIPSERVKACFPNFVSRDMIVVTNGFNFEKHYQPISSSHMNNKIKIVYANGGRIKLNNFKKEFIDTLNLFLKKRSECELDVISDNDFDYKNFSQCNFLGSFDGSNYKKKLLERSYHVGIVPLGTEEDANDLKFNLCKSPFKYLDYGALKIAGIYSKSPVYTEVIENRYNGLLVENTVDAWTAALEELTENKKLRNAIIENAQKDVKENHHISKAAKQWMEVIEKIMELK